MAAEIRPSQQHVKRVIAEMEGKNAIIMDSGADLDDAVRGTVVSAFGYQGQKCGGASRVIVVDGIYDASVRRLVQAERGLPVGLPEVSTTFVGPVLAVMRAKYFTQAVSFVDNMRYALKSKAGRPGYLLQFVEPHTMTESTLRRGFAPDKNAWQGV